MNAKAEPRPSASRELTITRIFAAPRSLVFQAWTDPKHMAQWWGPYDSTMPVCEMDVRPGGAIRIEMRGPDGAVYPMKGVFREIVPPERLVFATTAMEDEAGKPGLEVLNTVTFAEHRGQTRLTLHARVVKIAPAAAATLAGMEAGWTQSLDRLEDRLTGTAGREIVVARVIHAPRELVFKAWTEPEHVAQWWGPNGFTNTIHEMDVRPGGVWRFVMHGPDGVDYPNRIVFSEVVKPERLVYTHGEEGEPGQFHVRVTFAAVGAVTHLTMRLLFRSATERDDVVAKVNAVVGANQTLGRLAEHVAKMVLPLQAR